MVCEDIIISRNFCIDAKTGPSQLWMNHNRPVAFSLDKIGKARFIQTFCITLDQLLEMENIKNIDYIKIDAEGAEPRILSGGIKTIGRYRPIIQTEGYYKKNLEFLSNYKGLRIEGTRNTILLPEENFQTFFQYFDSRWSLIND